MRIPSRAQIEATRKTYPVGSRVVLDSMDDPQAPKPGTQGTVQYVDDMNQVGVAWDGGGSLSLIPGVDGFHKVRTEEEAKTSILYFAKKYPDCCPRCGRKATETNRLLSLSRRLDVMICDGDGRIEAFEDFGVMKKKIERAPLTDWYAVKGEANESAAD